MHSIETFAHLSISLGNTNYNYNKFEQSYNHLRVLTNKKCNLIEVGIVIAHDAYELQRTPAGLQDRNTKWNFCCSNRTRMVSQWTFDGQKKTKCLSFCVHKICESGCDYPNLVGHRSLFCQNQCRQSVKKELQAKRR